MSKTCANCNYLNSRMEEQKSKLHLLETRLKDLVRAYKVVCKERDNLQAINSSVDIDARQQKRIAELEESVIHMSSLCGNLELGRKQDKDRIKELQEKYEHLSNELDQTKILQKKIILSVNTSKPVELQNNYSQTDIIENVEKVESLDQWTQIDSNDPLIITMENKNEIRNKNETAVVAPVLRNQKSESNQSQQLENNDDNNKICDQVLTNTGISLFHLNELARKELELADYRLRLREYECSLRELQWNYTNDKYRFQSRIANLELVNKNLMGSDNQRQFSCNNINIVYIKNVLNKLMETTDKKQKQSMINALITALDSMQISSN